MHDNSCFSGAEIIFVNQLYIESSRFFPFISVRSAEIPTKTCSFMQTTSFSASSTSLFVRYSYFRAAFTPPDTSQKHFSFRKPDSTKLFFGVFSNSCIHSFQFIPCLYAHFIYKLPFPKSVRTNLPRRPAHYDKTQKAPKSRFLSKFTPYRITIKNTSSCI